MNSCLSSFQQEREVQTWRLSTGFPKTLPSHGQLSTECDMLNISSFHKYLLSQALEIRRKQKRQVPALTDRLTGERNTKYFHKELESQTSHGSHQLQEVVRFLNSHSRVSVKSGALTWYIVVFWGACLSIMHVFGIYPSLME